MPLPGRMAIGLASPQPGHCEQNPNKWWNSTAAASRNVLRELDPRVAAVAVFQSAPDLRGVHGRWRLATSPQPPDAAYRKDLSRGTTLLGRSAS
jgi:hypothetical protein